MDTENELQLADFLQRLPNYPGQCYLKFEQQQLNDYLPQLYGYYLVQLGVSDVYHLESNSPIRHSIYAGKFRHDVNRTAVVADLQALPFQYESIDVMLLPHTLEFCNSPERLLSELYNVVIPGGKVILFGFNPVSCLGVTKLLKFSKNAHWIGKLYRPGNVRSWLRQSGFTVEAQNMGCFLPPIKNENRRHALRSLEKYAIKCFPYLLSVYAIVAEKKIVPLIPAKPRVFPAKISVRAGFPEPSANKSI
jgi:SAM-dependent methyltransferase